MKIIKLVTPKMIILLSFVVMMSIAGGSVAPVAAMPLDGSISGTITNVMGEPLGGIQVDFWREDPYTFPGFWWHLASTFTLMDGTYSTPPMPNGSYRVFFSDPSGVYASEYYNDKQLFGEADAFWVWNNSVPGIDAVLAYAQVTTGGMAGTVTRESGPLANVFVTVYRFNGLIWEVKGSALTSTSGSYTISGLSAGNYRVYFFPPLGSNLGPEFYNDVHDAITYAHDVAVVAGATTTGIDAFLTIPPPPIGWGSSATGWTIVNPLNGQVIIQMPKGNLSDITISAFGVFCEVGLPSDVMLILTDLDEIPPDLSATFPMTENPPGSGTFEVTIPAAQLPEIASLSVTYTCGELATNDARPDAENKNIGHLYLVDPTGYITDATTSAQLEGVALTLYNVPGWRAREFPGDTGANTCESNESKNPGDPWSQPAPTDKGKVALPTEGKFTPEVNPLSSKDDGSYNWDLTQGCWYVIAEMLGYETQVSPVVGKVSLPIIDLHFQMAPVMVQFSSATYEVFEDENAVITVTLSGATSQPVTVDYATSDGTAIAGVDYLAASGTLTFAPGEVSKTFEVPFIDDDLDEPNETINLTLSNVTNANLGTPSTSVLTILDNDPAVKFSASDYQVDEDGATVTIHVTLNIPVDATVTVDYATSDGTAVAGSDYTATSGTLTFPTGVLEQTFNVTILEDTLDEAAETINLTLSNVTNAFLGKPREATVTIQDNDPPPSVQFSATSYQVGEGDGTATITANLSVPSGQTSTVDYATSDGTATGGSDYTVTTGTLTFAAGETSKTFDVPILDDGLDEGSETVVLTLSNPVNLALGSPNPVTLTILDNDPLVSFSDGTYIVDESGGTAVVTATLSEASAWQVTVDFATSDGTATAGNDYTAAAGTLTFAPGETSKTFNVTILEDAIDESDETVNLTLSNSTNAGLGTPNPATLIIQDNDGIPSVRFSAANYNVSEGAGSGTVTVALSNASADTVTVDYATSNGTATAGSDYTATSGTLTFAPGELSKTFPVTILEDVLDEANETVNLTLSNATNAVLGLPNPATLTIIDNDPMPTVQFTSATYSENEFAGLVTIGVNLSAASGQQVTVKYATSDGTATAGSDYTAASGTLTFAAGEVSKTFNVFITDDALDEPDETVNLTLSTPTNAGLGTPNPATLTILDNDPTPSYQFSAATYSISEGGGVATINVTLSSASALAIAVDFATSDGTATAGSDYIAASGTVTFAPGEVTKSFTVTILEDTLDEPNETLSLSLSGSAIGRAGLTQAATLTILDNDPAPTVQLSTATYSVNENAGTATVTVNLNTASGKQVTVDYFTSDGTATAGSDYTAASGTLTFAPGEASKTFTVTILDNIYKEPDETINLTLSSPTGANLGVPATGAITIVDDDPWRVWLSLIIKWGP